MVSKEGIVIDCHYVTTEDGYILQLYHIPPPATNLQTKPKTILLMHGLQSSALDFVMYPNISAGYYFHRHGFDVWLGNARGNTFSRNHTTLDPNTPPFWSFTWHEIGFYDLPTMIDFILAETQQSRLTYVGYSQGGTIVYVLLSERPEYNYKIESVQSLAAAVFFNHTRSVLSPILVNINAVKRFAEDIELYEWNSYRHVSHIVKVMGELCTVSFLAEICKIVMDQFFGPFAENSYYNELLLDYSSVNPNGASYLQYIHYGQLYKAAGRFQKFDYGFKRNMELYRQPKPPAYNLSNVRTKVNIIYGTNDKIVKPETSLMLIANLKNAVVVVNKMDFNHLDFVVGRRAYIIPRMMLQVMKKFATLP